MQAMINFVPIIPCSMFQYKDPAELCEVSYLSEGINKWIVVWNFGGTCLQTSLNDSATSQQPPFADTPTRY